MRIAPCLIAFTALVLTFAHPSTAAAQQPALPACEGSYNIIRVSDINEGMMPKFLEAVAAQKAWYKQVGSPDQISVMRIIDTKTGAFSVTQALTSHIAPTAKRPDHDAGYDAFVALFKASSTIKSEYITCMAN